MQHALLDVIGDFYDCAIEPARWSAALEKTAALIGGIGAAISVQYTTNNKTPFQSHWNIAPEFEASLQKNIEIDPIIPLAGQTEINQPVSAFGALGEGNLKGSRWYQETAAPNGIGDTAAVLLAKTAEKSTSLLLYRESNREAYDHNELAALRILAPHIRRAASIAGLLEERARERNMLSAALEMLADGIVLTDGFSRIIYANASALRYLRCADVLHCEGDRLAVHDLQRSYYLRCAIAAASGNLSGNSGVSRSLVLKSSSGSNLAIWITPLRRDLCRDLDPLAAARVAVFIREIGALASPFPAELFVRHFGITQAENRVLDLLLQGMSLERAAETLGVSANTAKTHLARLFTKTGTQRQADLARLAISAFSPASA
jgi:DNA-binding CsgD family transcriptional regulator/PAS domain-containing protein